MQKVGLQTKAVAAARDVKDKGFSFTRRTIALASVAAIIVLPILAGVLWPYTPISYGYEETTGGFLFFTEAAKNLTWATGTGIMITPIHSHLVYAIAGMYFGSSSTK